VGNVSFFHRFRPRRLSACKEFVVLVCVTPVTKNDVRRDENGDSPPNGVGLLRIFGRIDGGSG
jgi:hypothetical protein